MVSSTLVGVLWSETYRHDFHRIQDSIGEINDASSRCVEEIFASKLCYTSWSIHHKSVWRQFTHISLRSSRRISDAIIKIFHTNHQWLWNNGLCFLRRCTTLQSQKHIATNWWVETNYKLTWIILTSWIYLLKRTGRFYRKTKFGMSSFSWLAVFEQFIKPTWRAGLMSTKRWLTINF